MSDVRIQNTEFRNRNGEPRVGSPFWRYLNSVFCILTSDIFAVPDLWGHPNERRVEPATVGRRAGRSFHQSSRIDDSAHKINERE